LHDAQQADALPCQLAAHHSRGIIEPSERGLADVLSREFKPAPYALSSMLTFCDTTTSPDGEPVPAEQRLAAIHHRYGPGHLVSRSLQRAMPMILSAVKQARNRAAHTVISLPWYAFPGHGPADGDSGPASDAAMGSG
jgi:hypothetical protein